MIWPCCPHARALRGRAAEAVGLVIDRAERRRSFGRCRFWPWAGLLTFWQRHGFRAVDLGIDLSSYGTATFMTRPVDQNPNM